MLLGNFARAGVCLVFNNIQVGLCEPCGPDVNKNFRARRVQDGRARPSVVSYLLQVNSLKDIRRVSMY